MSFWEIFGDAGLEVQVWLGLEEGFLRGEGGLEYLFKDFVSVVE